MVFASVKILIDLSETLVNVPKKEQTQTGSCCSLTVIFDLENPVLIILVVSYQKIFTKGCVDEGINIS